MIAIGARSQSDHIRAENAHRTPSPRRIAGGDQPRRIDTLQFTRVRVLQAQLGKRGCGQLLSVAGLVVLGNEPLVTMER
jgi:hypothetical protein